MAKAFYISLGAGLAFIAIGIAAAIYSNVPVDVALDGKVGPGLSDTSTPNMNAGNVANITLTGSAFNITILDPDSNVIKSEIGSSNFSYSFTAQKDGIHKIEVKNMGNSELDITGHAPTKGSALELSAQLTLIVTGVIVVGIGLRFKNK
jgi:hypothetical protein